MSLLTSAVSMTKAMVQIDSTDPGTYEKAMADWIEQQLSDLSNVLITRENVLPGRPNLTYGYRCHRRRMDVAAF